MILQPYATCEAEGETGGCCCCCLKCCFQKRAQVKLEEACQVASSKGLDFCPS